MKQLAEAFERRAHTRLQGRFPCRLLIDGGCHPGVVRDFSIRGFFVESGVVLPIGASVVVAFDAAEDKRFVLEASVPHRRSAARSLVDLVQDGVGLRVDDPPEAYRGWVAVSIERGSNHA
jgi:hypothetical protein